MKKSIQYLIVTALALGMVACKKESAPAPATSTTPTPGATTNAPANPESTVKVTAVNVGKSIGADKKIAEPSESFAKTDLIYASVEASGSGNVNIRAKWISQGGDKTVDVGDAAETVAVKDAYVSAFHVSKPDGWEPGNYQIEIFLDGKSVGTKKFTVK